jgi:16S rRNA (cytosine1402-N4)-methyltransferase
LEQPFDQMNPGQNFCFALADHGMRAPVAAQRIRPVDKFFTPDPGHLPVLLEEAVAAVRPEQGAVLVDATFGGGGYSRALLDAAPCRVYGVDRDPEAVARGQQLERARPAFTMLEGRFGELEELLVARELTAVDGIVADLGVSSFQLDDPERGFAFSIDGPLDMRMDRAGPNAADLLAELEPDELARIFSAYGDEPEARRIARAIAARRRQAPIRRTDELRALVARVKGRRPAQRDPATLVFQALRIAVNDEAGELERLLAAAGRLLKPGGRLVLVTFHSGEDRLVKRFIDTAGGRVVHRSRHLPPGPEPRRLFTWATRGVQRPTAAEVQRNPRARSAKLRVAVRSGEKTARDGAEPAEPHWPLRLAA